MRTGRSPARAGALVRAVLAVLALAVLAAAAPAVPGPPAVRVLSPADGQRFDDPDVTVRAAVRSPSGEPVTWVRVLVNGKAAGNREVVLDDEAPRAGPRPGEEVRSVRVRLPAADCTLAVVAETATARSEPALVHLLWSGKGFTVKPKLYVLAVGVSRYRRGELRLDYPAKDAADLAEALRRQQGRLYREVEARVLADRDATRDRVLDGLEWLQRQATSLDVAVLFLAGHGVTEPGTGEYRYLPWDADPQAVRRTMIFGGEIESALRHTPGKVLLFLDTCHAGGVLGQGALRGVLDTSAFVRDLANADNGVVVFASSTGRQPSKESPAWRNGAFTKALLEGLQGRAAYERSEAITANMLAVYLSERVKELTAGLQTPTTARPGLMPDFPVAIGEAGVRGHLATAPSRPVYKQWWFWGSIGAGIAAGIATGVVLGTRTPCAGVMVSDCQPLFR